MVYKGQPIRKLRKLAPYITETLNTEVREEENLGDLKRRRPFSSKIRKMLRSSKPCEHTKKNTKNVVIRVL